MTTETDQETARWQASLDGGKTCRRLLPILFTSQNSQLVFDGKKTQTRRLLNPQPPQSTMLSWQYWPERDAFVPSGILDGFTSEMKHGVKPRYRVGDVLWVREPWQTLKVVDEYKPTALSDGEPVYHTGVGNWHKMLAPLGKVRPGLFMPLRFARPARYEVVAVKCDRVNEISEDDAKAEGAEVNATMSDAMKLRFPTYKVGFRIIWNSIHGPGAFERGDWVFAYEFRKIV